MQDWQKEILERNIQRQLNIEKSFEINIGKEEDKNLSKAYKDSLNTINIAIENGQIPNFLLEKGKKANVGEKREWKGGTYEKTLKGWKFVGKEKSNNKWDEDEASKYRKTKAYKSSKEGRQKDLDEHNKKYPELEKIKDEIAGEVAKLINSKTSGVKSEMSYKAQWVLEELIKELKDRV